LKLFIFAELARSSRVSQRLVLAHGVGLILTTCVIFLVSLQISTAETVHIPDPGLRAVLELALGKEVGADITQADMLSLESLEGRCRFLLRSKMERWRMQRWICKSDSDVPDPREDTLTVPCGAPCESNSEVFKSVIQDLTGLEFATNLVELHLGRNQISDLSALSALTNLTYLDLGENWVLSDVSPLKNLKKLTHLGLRGNFISDVSPLKNLTKLIELDLDRNRVSDVSPLKDLINLTHLDLETNQVADVSPLKNLIKLIYLDLDTNLIPDLSGLEGMTELTEIDLSDNQISDLSPLKNMRKLRHLDLDSNRISDISPLENLINLSEMLDLHGNQISDILPLKNMTQLKWELDLDDNQITDVSPLRNMIKLRNLDLDGNRISDASPLQNLRNLRNLDLDSNRISDVSPLKNLTNLEELDLHNNQISDVSPLKNLTNLIDLDLDDNKIPDISALGALTKLTVLDLDGNQVSNVYPLKDLINLKELDLHDNKITDLSPLRNLINLTVLDLRGNRISDFSPIAGLIVNLVEYDASNQSVPTYKPEDVNRDGTVNIADLVLVASNFADPDLEALAGTNIYPDVNHDGVVNLIDLLLVAVEMGSDTAAPALSKSQVETSNLTTENLAQWIQLAKKVDVEVPNLQKGISILEQLLALLSGVETSHVTTALLANYPNPFNPETWIPYQLAKPTEVSISIHSVNGKLIRTLELGHLPAGIYHNKSQSAYWDGRNECGESVASGVYFYTLTAGNFTATRKMFIRK
jgi:internalin A